MKKLTTGLLLAVLMMSTTMNILPVQSVEVGVEEGVWAKYAVSVRIKSNDSGNDSRNLPWWFDFLKNVEWVKNTVFYVLETEIGIVYTAHLKDGTERDIVASYDIREGTYDYIEFFIGIPFIAPDIDKDSRVFKLGWNNIDIWISRTTFRKYLGQTRETNYFTISMVDSSSDINLRFYWDKSTGILYEWWAEGTLLKTGYRIDFDISFKIVETNLWDKQKQVSQISYAEVVNTFKTPLRHSEGLTWDGKYLWIGVWGFQRIYKVDPNGGEIVDFLEIPSIERIGSAGLAWDGEYLWMGDRGVDMIYKIDPYTGSIVKSIRFPGPRGTGPGGLTYDGEYLWVGNANNDEIYKIDPDTGNVVLSFHSPLSFTSGLAWDGQYIWTSGSEDIRVFKIDPSTGDAIESFNIPSANPRGLAWDGQYLWLLSNNGRISSLNILPTTPSTITTLEPTDPIKKMVIVNNFAVDKFPEFLKELTKVTSPISVSIGIETVENVDKVYLKTNTQPSVIPTVKGEEGVYYSSHGHEWSWTKEDVQKAIEIILSMFEGLKEFTKEVATPYTPEVYITEIVVKFKDGTELSKPVENMRLPTWEDAVDEKMQVWKSEGGRIIRVKSPVDILVNAAAKKVGAVYENGKFVGAVNEVVGAYYSGPEDPEFVYLPYEVKDYKIQVFGDGKYSLTTTVFKDEQRDTKEIKAEAKKDVAQEYSANLELQKETRSVPASTPSLQLDSTIIFGGIIGAAIIAAAVIIRARKK